MNPPPKPDVPRHAPVPNMFAGREMVDAQTARRADDDPDLRLVLHWQKLFAERARKTGSA